MTGVVRNTSVTLATEGSITKTVIGENATDAASLEQNKIDRTMAPQWQALGVMVSVVVVLGGLVYWPIRESTND